MDIGRLYISTCMYSDMISKMTSGPKHLFTSITLELESLVALMDDRMLLQ